MVSLTRLTGIPFALNPDLIERVDETPDTVITLVDGTKYLVRESIAEVVEAVLTYRARVIAAAGSLDVSGSLDLSGSLDAAERSVVRRNRLVALPGPNDPPVDAPREG